MSSRDVLLITGGSSGIGLATKEKFLSMGVEVEDISTREGRDLSMPIREFYHPTYKYVILNAVRYIHRTWEETTYHTLQEHMTVNLINQIDIVRHLLAQCRISSGGSILTLSSTDLETLPSEQILYNLAKSGMETFALSLSKELDYHRVNTLRLGFTMTPLCDPSLPMPTSYLNASEVADYIWDICSLDVTGQTFRFTKED